MTFSPTPPETPSGEITTLQGGPCLSLGSLSDPDVFSVLSAREHISNMTNAACAHSRGHILILQTPPWIPGDEWPSCFFSTNIMHLQRRAEQSASLQSDFCLGTVLRGGTSPIVWTSGYYKMLVDHNSGNWTGRQTGKGKPASSSKPLGHWLGKYLYELPFAGEPSSLGNTHLETLDFTHHL